MAEIGAIVWGVRDIPRAVEFWSRALDYEPSRAPDDDWAMLVPRGGRPGIQLSLNLVSSPAARRHHLDLFCEDRDADVARFVALGARVVESWRYDDDPDYVVLADPDGNPFCLIQIPIPTPTGE